MASTVQSTELGRDDWDRRRSGLWNRLALILVTAGVLWRVLRYLLVFPIWDDEAMLAVNFLHADYGQLATQLDNCQIAPILFLWSELAVTQWLGTSELSLRLLPLLAGLGSLFLFWRLVSLVLSPLERMLAMGILSVAVWPVSMSSMIKPYAFDLFCSLALLLPTVHWLRRPESLRWLMSAILLAPLCLLASFPAVFIAGGASIAMLPVVCRQRSVGTWITFAIFNVVAASVFLFGYYVFGVNQLNSPVNGVTTHAGMMRYWAEGFPPDSAVGVLGWLFMTHVDRMFAYPIGGERGCSALTTLCLLAGAWRFCKTQRYDLLRLCAAPFGLGLLAAVLHRYPYGVSCRLAQHVAPLVCLLAGTGIAYFVRRWSRSDEERTRWVIGYVVVLVLIAVVGVTGDILQPYRSPLYAWTRASLNDLVLRADGDGPIMVLNAAPELSASAYWRMEMKRDRFRFDTGDNKHRTAPEGDRIWCVCYGHAHGLDSATRCLEYQKLLEADSPGWKLVEQIPYQIIPDQPKNGPSYYEFRAMLFVHHDPNVRAARTSRIDANGERKNVRR